MIDKIITYLLSNLLYTLVGLSLILCIFYINPRVNFRILPRMPRLNAARRRRLFQILIPDASFLGLFLLSQVAIGILYMTTKHYDLPFSTSTDTFRGRMLKAFVNELMKFSSILAGLNSIPMILLLIIGLHDIVMPAIRAVRQDRQLPVLIIEGRHPETGELINVGLTRQETSNEIVFIARSLNPNWTPNFVLVFWRARRGLLNQQTNYFWYSVTEPIINYVSLSPMTIEELEELFHYYLN